MMKKGSYRENRETDSEREAIVFVISLLFTLGHCFDVCVWRGGGQSTLPWEFDFLNYSGIIFPSYFSFDTRLRIIK